MRIVKPMMLAGALGLGWAGAAMAGEVLLHPYKAANYCPTGLQPVTVGGVICCGVPNTSAAYVDRAGGHKRKVHRKVARHAPQPRYYSVEGEKGVRMR